MTTIYFAIKTDRQATLLSRIIEIDARSEAQTEFERERTRLIEYINRTTELGEAHFDGKESHSFGVLNKKQWSNMLYKHIDHHLTQFGA